MVVQSALCALVVELATPEEEERLKTTLLATPFSAALTQDHGLSQALRHESIGIEHRQTLDDAATPQRYNGIIQLTRFNQPPLGNPLAFTFKYS